MGKTINKILDTKTVLQAEALDSFVIGIVIGEKDFKKVMKEVRVMSKQLLFMLKDFDDDTDQLTIYGLNIVKANNMEKYTLEEVNKMIDAALENHELLFYEELRQIKTELLAKGHGGGNWRRLITSIVDPTPWKPGRNRPVIPNPKKK